MSIEAVRDLLSDPEQFANDEQGALDQLSPSEARLVDIESIAQFDMPLFAVNATFGRERVLEILDGALELREEMFSLAESLPDLPDVPRFSIWRLALKCAGVFGFLAVLWWIITSLVAA